MNISDMNLEELKARAAEILEEIESANEERAAELLAEAEEIKARKEELTAQETRKKAAQALASGADGANTIERSEEDKMPVFTRDTKEYRSIWLRHLQGAPLTEEERSSLTSDTSAAGYAIPTITENRIFETLVQVAPLIGEIELLHIPGNVSILYEGTVNAAAIHTENASITAADDTIGRVLLTGYEMCKILTISAKMALMSIDAFEDWLVSNLTRKLAELIENYIVNGTGSSQPTGIASYASWVANTNAVDWASTAPTAAELLKQISLVNASYLGVAKWLMNSSTFYNTIVTLRDDKNPGIVDISGPVPKIFGYPVVFSSKVTAGDLYFGSLKDGMVGNFAQDIEVEADKSSAFRSNGVDYRGACIFDCAPRGTGLIVKSAATIS